MNNNLKKSVQDFTWQQQDFDERKALAISQKFQISSVLAKILAAKNIDFDEIENFLEPKLKNILPNPFDLLDMDLAVDHVLKAIKTKKKITIFADYDVDGATSSALIKNFLGEIGVNVGIYVPDRKLEGYGPNSQALLNLKKSGTDLVITVDCGTVAFKPLEDAKKAGLEIIVIDHHIGVIEKPEALAVINPNRIDEKFPHKNLCAAGVSFLFIVALNKALREDGFYKNNIREPNLLQFLDLVALGTVCDVMPLTGLNRAFVAGGLKILKKRSNLGLRLICDLAALNEEPSSYHLGFILGPRINAGGRVGKSDLGARILSSSDEMEASEIALQLENFNKQRKEIELQILDEAVNQIEKKQNGFGVDNSFIFAFSNNWHQGVIGIVASRLKDLYNKPVAVISLENSKGKASCRSINGIDFGSLILQARMEGLLLEGGGHAMAGGFSVEEEKIAELYKFFDEKTGKKVMELSAKKEMFFADILDLSQVNIEFIKELENLEPFGVGNYKPKFIIRNLQKMRVNLMGQNQDHISCIFSSKSLVGFNGNLQGVAFRAAKTALGEILLDQNYTKPIDVVGQLNINSWMGVDKVQLVIEDVLV
ncbi:MAG: single-stranded-DNA-specific exonuclease RecJ [Pelagibacterales bacterium]|nr:single-stranded-DNA-specific exonuclease RecJ [Pelagibacterales bacterium]